MTVTKIGSVNTPRAVIVAVDYEDVVRGFSRDVRLKWHECEAHGQCTVSEQRERIHGCEASQEWCRKRMSFAVFLSSASIGCILQLFLARRR